MNLRSFANITNSALDPFKTNNALGAAVTLARTDITTGLGAAINTSLFMRDLITPTSTLLSNRALTTIDMSMNLNSLAGLRAPYDQLHTLRIADNYMGTISTLASVANLAERMQSAFPALSTTNQIPQTTNILGTVPVTTSLANAFTTVCNIAPSYISSASSIYAVESALAHAKTFSATAPTLTGKSLLAGTPLGSLDHLHNTISSMSIAAQSVWSGINRTKSIFDLVSTSILRMPAVELYASAHAAASVSLSRDALPARDNEIEAILEEDGEAIEARLAILHRDLVEMYRGGLHAIEAGGPDWQRHSMTSFREITTQVLHRLAPDKEVIASGGELHNERPTRRARLIYIFSSVGGGELTKFFESDIKAALELFELLNGGTHRLGGKATPEQFYYLKGRLAGLLSSMLSARGY